MEFKLSELKGETADDRMVTVKRAGNALELRAGHEADTGPTWALLRRDEALILSSALRDMAEGLDRQ